MKSITKTFAKLILDFNNFNVQRKSASLAFYFILSLAPLLILIIMICGSVLNSEIAIQNFIKLMEKISSDQVTAILKLIIKNITIPQLSFNTIISFVILIYTSTLAIEDLRISLDELYEVQSQKFKFITILFKKSKTFLSTLLCGFFIIVLSLSEPFLKLMAKVTQKLSFDIVTLHIFDYFFTIIVATLVFMYFNSFLPHKKIPFKATFKGSFFSAILFLGGKKFLALYLKSKSLALTFGPGGHLLF
ncbi:MAG: membrane protein, partial [Thermoproteota archaeon]